MDVKNGQEISIGSTSQTLINISDYDLGVGNSAQHEIRVLTGSVKFIRGDNTISSQHAFTSADGPFIMTMPVGELYAKQTSGSDTFVVTV